MSDGTYQTLKSVEIYSEITFVALVLFFIVFLEFERTL